jgi:hypothetical protein
MTMLTRKPLTGVLLGALALALSLAAVVPAAHAADAEEGVRFLDEGWWLRYRSPLAPVPNAGDFGAPADATEIPRQTVRNEANPYDGEYTRISTLPGGEDGWEAIAAFAFDLWDLGGGLAEAQITGGTVTFVAAPLESAPGEGDGAGGQRNEEEAVMIACLATEMFPPDFGGPFEERPDFDCGTSAPLEPADPVNDRPAWTLDLGAFTAAWAQQNHGFVVVPDPAAETELFHVAFPTHLNPDIDLDDFPPPTADITFEAEELDIPSFPTGDPVPTPGGAADGGAPVPTSGGFDGGVGSTSGSGGGFTNGSSGGFDGGTADAPLAADGDVAPADEPSTADAETLDDAALAPPAGPETPMGAAATGGAGSGLGYAVLALLGLGLAVALGYSLTREPELAVERQGAVSKLMERRQGALPRGA